MAVAERHTEVPFGIRTDTLYLTGVIDLAFSEPDGWVLVDFKSDHIIDDAHLHELTTYYTPQIRTYAERFTEITGERVKERGLLFTEKPVYVKV